MSRQYQVTFGNQSETFLIPVLANDLDEAMKSAAKIGRKKHNPYGYVTQVKTRVNLEYQIVYNRTGSIKVKKLPTTKPLRKPKRVQKEEALISQLLQTLEKVQNQQTALANEEASLRAHLKKLGHSAP